MWTPQDVCVCKHVRACIHMWLLLSLCLCWIWLYKSNQNAVCLFVYDSVHMPSVKFPVLLNTPGQLCKHWCEAREDDEDGTRGEWRMQVQLASCLVVAGTEHDNSCLSWNNVSEDVYVSLNHMLQPRRKIHSVMIKNLFQIAQTC